jgi:hypothetical protein
MAAWVLNFQICVEKRDGSTSHAAASQQFGRCVHDQAPLWQFGIQACFLVEDCQVWRIWISLMLPQIPYYGVMGHCLLQQVPTPVYEKLLVSIILG